jgi:hypothetical protein
MVHQLDPTLPPSEVDAVATGQPRPKPSDATCPVNWLLRGLPRCPRIERLHDDCVRGITHKDIAERLRVYRESVTAGLGELGKAGIIAVERKQIRIIDRVRLERATVE